MTQWEKIQKLLVPQEERLDFDEFQKICDNNPASALVKLEGIFIKLTYERMLQLASEKKLSTIEKANFQSELLDLAWKEIRKKYHCSFAEYDNASTFIDISKKKYTDFTTTRDVNKALRKFNFIFKIWLANLQLTELSNFIQNETKRKQVNHRKNEKPSMPHTDPASTKETKLDKDQQVSLSSKQSLKKVESINNKETDKEKSKSFQPSYNSVQSMPEISEADYKVERDEKNVKTSVAELNVRKERVNCVEKIERNVKTDTNNNTRPVEHRFFSYLLELAQLKEKVVRNYTKYEKYWDIDDLQKVSGFSFKEENIEMNTLFEISKVNISSEEKLPPDLPKSLLEWIDYDYKNENDLPQYKETIFVNKENQFVDLEDDSTRVKSYQSYTKIWNTWAQNLRLKKQQRKLYDDFFDLISRFEKEGESIELVYGRGLLTWQQSDPKIDDINSPLLLARLELDLDAKKGIISAEFSDDGFLINNEMFAGIRLSNIERVQNIFEQLEKTDLFNPDMSLIQEFVQTIHSHGQFTDSDDQQVAMNHVPTIYDRSTIILRKKNTRVLRDDLTSIINAIEHDTLKINDAIKSLINKDFNVNTEEDDLKDPNNLLYKRNDLFFPLPANEQQVQIVERLKNNYGVTVQGPPGTGKTHTIANLVSHYLSQGKKVLITSQKENALKVLRDKIPNDIRDLCVPVLGGGRESMQKIEKSINTINEKLGELNFDTLKSNVGRNLILLDESYRKEASFRSKLKEYAEKEGAHLNYKNETLLRYEVAKRIKSQDTAFNWIIDDLKISAEFPLSKEEFQKFWDYRKRLSQSDLRLINVELPVVNQDIKNGEDFALLIESQAQLESQKEDIDNVFKEYQLPKNNDQLTLILEKTSFLETYKIILEKSHNQYILTELFAGGTRKQHWLDLISTFNEEKDKIFDLQNQLIVDDFDKEKIKSKAILKDLPILKNRLETGKSLQSKMFTLLNKKLHYLIKEPVINDHPIETITDLNTVEKAHQFHHIKNDIAIKYNRHLERFGVPLLDPDAIDFPHDFENKTKSLLFLLDLFSTMTDIQKIGSVEYETFLNGEKISNMKKDFKIAQGHINYVAWLEEYNNDLKKLKKFHEKSRHTITGELLSAMKNYKVNLWQTSLEKLASLHELKIDAQHFTLLGKKLKQILPLTYNDMIQTLGANDPFPEDYLEAFELRKLQTWLDKTKDMNQESLYQQLQKELNLQRRLKSQVVKDATWRSQLKSITDEQKRALGSWKSFIKRVGKGTGKYARQHLLDARKQMKIAQKAIPVWIMPITQVMENFPIHNELFDVVIFDESSQCNIYSVNVLLRSKKMIVVGDDEQISPESIGTKQEDVNDLVNRYINDIPNARLFDGQISLYEIAEQIFPKEGKLMLREHFRCVPEIIQFSNDLSYGGQMVPLRLPLPEERIDPPVTAIQVTEGYNPEGDKDINEPEADRIAEDMIEIVNDSKYRNQTIGVISLQGQKQHKLLELKIREKIGDSEFVKRKIICGNPYDLQGDERDIIFLSMMIAPNRNFNALTKNSDKQRYNVAASRAKNQLRLYHSVSLNDLKTDDLRYQLLSYCQSPNRVPEKIQDLSHLIESPFEKDVMKLILAKGYRVTPQVEVGHYRIDMVIEGIRNRLAVEIDGEKWHGPEKYEEDMQRQAILERSGWHFWRIRGNEFYLNRQKAMESLWRLLDKMDIQPFEFSEEES